MRDLIRYIMLVTRVLSPSDKIRMLHPLAIPCIIIMILWGFIVMLALITKAFLTALIKDMFNFLTWW